MAIPLIAALAAKIGGGALAGGAAAGAAGGGAAGALGGGLFGGLAKGAGLFGRMGGGINSPGILSGAQNGLSAGGASTGGPSLSNLSFKNMLPGGPPQGVSNPQVGQGAGAEAAEEPSAEGGSAGAEKLNDLGGLGKKSAALTGLLGGAIQASAGSAEYADGSKSVSNSTQAGLGEGIQKGSAIGNTLGKYMGPGGRIIGTAAGAIIGGAAGAITAKRDAKKANYNLEQARNNAVIAGANKSSAKAEELYAKNNATNLKYYEMGGVHYGSYDNGGGEVNAMVDNKEIIKSPDGNIDMAMGPKATDKILASLQPGTEILSDTMKMGGKSYAEIGKNIPRVQRESQAIIDNPNSTRLDKKTAELNMKNSKAAFDRIMTVQEDNRVVDNLDKLRNAAKKYSKKGVKNLPMFSGGGIAGEENLTKVNEGWKYNPRFDTKDLASRQDIAGDMYDKTSIDGFSEYVHSIILDAANAIAPFSNRPGGRVPKYTDEGTPSWNIYKIPSGRGSLIYPGNNELDSQLYDDYAIQRILYQEIPALENAKDYDGLNEDQKIALFLRNRQKQAEKPKSLSDLDTSALKLGVPEAGNLHTMNFGNQPAGNNAGEVNVKEKVKAMIRKVTPTTPDEADVKDDKGIKEEKDPKKKSGFDFDGKGLLGGLLDDGLSMMDLAPYFYNKKKSKEAVEQIDPEAFTIKDKITPDSYDAYPELRENRRAAAINRHQAAMSGNTRGASMAYNSYLAKQKANMDGAVWAKKRKYDSAQHSAAQSGNISIEQGNNQIKMAVNEMNMRSRAKKEDFAAKAAEQLSQWSQRNRLDRNTKANDAKTHNVYKALIRRYGADGEFEDIYGEAKNAAELAEAAKKQAAADKAAKKAAKKTKKKETKKKSS